MNYKIKLIEICCKFYIDIVSLKSVNFFSKQQNLTKYLNNKSFCAHHIVVRLQVQGRRLYTKFSLGSYLFPVKNVQSVTYQTNCCN